MKKINEIFRMEYIKSYEAFEEKSFQSLLKIRSVINWKI